MTRKGRPCCQKLSKTSRALFPRRRAPAPPTDGMVALQRAPVRLTPIVVILEPPPLDDDLAEFKALMSPGFPPMW